MKINNQKIGFSNKRALLIALTAVIILGAIYSGYLYLGQQEKSRDTANVSLTGVNYGPATDEQKAAGDRQKVETISGANNQDAASPGDTALSVRFTAINQVDGQLQVRTLIDSVVSGAGLCTLTLVKDGVMITKQSDVQAGPSTSTCKGFTVAVGELSPGAWKLAVKVAAGSQKGSVNQSYTVQ